MTKVGLKAHNRPTEHKGKKRGDYCQTKRTVVLREEKNATWAAARRALKAVMGGRRKSGGIRAGRRDNPKSWGGG